MSYFWIFNRLPLINRFKRIQYLKKILWQVTDCHVILSTNGFTFNGVRAVDCVVVLCCVSCALCFETLATITFIYVELSRLLLRIRKWLFRERTLFFIVATKTLSVKDTVLLRRRVVCEVSYHFVTTMPNVQCINCYVRLSRIRRHALTDENDVLVNTIRLWTYPREV